MVLQRSGYTVIGATSGSQALRILHSVRIDLVLSDHFLQGERGTDVASQMKAIRPELPILILSGAADMLEPSPHIDGVIQKGDSTTSLLVEIARALRL
jgi:DNA-binding NtrC family response regulator